MRVKCGSCQIEDIGRFNKLVDRKWRIFFLGNSIKIARCGKCRPIFPAFYYEIGEKINRIKIINKLKTEEELHKEIRKRLIKKKYHYNRNIKDEINSYGIRK